MSCRQNIDRSDMIGIVFVPARHARKERLGLAVLTGYVAAARARLARVRRWNSDKLPAVPSGFIFELTTEFAPALVQNGFVQALLLRYFSARCFKRSRCRLRHVANLQVLDTYHRVVFADLCRGFVQKVVSGVRNAAVNPLDAAFRLFPVVAEFGLASHATLVLREALFVLLKTVERR